MIHALTERRDFDGFTLEVDADARTRDHAEAFCRHLGSEPRAAPGLRMELRGVDTDAPDPGEELGVRASFHFDGVLGFARRGHFALWDGHSRVLVDPRLTRVAVSPLTDARVLQEVMMFAGFVIAMRSHGFFHLHAAAFRTPHGRQVLVAGDSGSGKTTLALAAHKAGATLVSEDAVFLRNNGAEGVRAASWPRELHVAPRTALAFPELGAEVCPVLRGKHVVALARIPRRERVLEHVDVLLFPRISQEASHRVTRVGSTEALGALLPPSALLAIDDAAERDQHLGLLTTLANDCASFRVELGADLLSHPASTASSILQALGRT